MSNEPQPKDIRRSNSTLNEDEKTQREEVMDFEVDPHEVRWYYDGKPMEINDSIRTEIAYRNVHQLAIPRRYVSLSKQIQKNENRTAILNNLFCPDFVEMNVQPIYWEPIAGKGGGRIERGIWFYYEREKQRPTDERGPPPRIITPLNNARQLEAQYISMLKEEKELAASKQKDGSRKEFPAATPSSSSQKNDKDTVTVLNTAGKNDNLKNEVKNKDDPKNPVVKVAIQKKGASADREEPPMLCMKFPDYEIRWRSTAQIEMVTKQSSGGLLRRIVGRGGGGKTRPVYRKYPVNSDWDNSEQEIRHVIFIIHGIGYGRSKSSIVFNTYQLRRNMQELIRDHWSNWKNGAILCLPVPWRRLLQLGTQRMSALYLRSFEDFRNSFNMTFLDAFYYMSSSYREEIFSSVLTTLTTLRDIFIQYNPNFTGAYHAFCHSLGAIITFDILIQKRLPFPIKNIFFTGAQVGVFLVLRKEKKLLESTNIYNVFGYNDPYAYRLEPLLNIEYSKVKPLDIYRAHEARELSAIPYHLIPRAYENEAEPINEANLGDDEENSPTSSVNEETPDEAKEPTSGPLFTRIVSQEIFPDSEEERKEAVLKNVPRLDYALPRQGFVDSSMMQNTVMMIVNALLKSHSVYWSNIDLAMFILQIIDHNNVPAEDSTPDPAAPHPKTESTPGPTTAPTQSTPVVITGKSSTTPTITAPTQGTPVVITGKSSTTPTITAPTQGTPVVITGKSSTTPTITAPTQGTPVVITGKSSTTPTIQSPSVTVSHQSPPTQPRLNPPPVVPSHSQPTKPAHFSKFPK